MALFTPTAVLEEAGLGKHRKGGELGYGMLLKDVLRECAGLDRAERMGLIDPLLVLLVLLVLGEGEIPRAGEGEEVLPLGNGREGEARKLAEGILEIREAKAVLAAVEVVVEDVVVEVVVVVVLEGERANVGGGGGAAGDRVKMEENREGDAGRLGAGLAGLKMAWLTSTQVTNYATAPTTIHITFQMLSSLATMVVLAAWIPRLTSAFL